MTSGIGSDQVDHQLIVMYYYLYVGNATVVQFLLVLFAGHLNDIMVYFMLVEEIGREVNSTLLKMTILIGVFICMGAVNTLPVYESG